MPDPNKKKSTSKIQDRDWDFIISAMINASLDTDFSDREKSSLNSNFANIISKYILSRSYKDEKNSKNHEKDELSNRTIIIRSLIVFFLVALPSLILSFIFFIPRILFRIFLKPFSRFILYLSLVTLVAWVLFHFLVVYPEENIPNVIDEKTRIELVVGKRENTIKAIQSIAGLGFFLTAIIGWKNYKISEDKNVSERFIKAIELLSDDRIQMRLGGVYSLERIARDSKEDHPVVMDVLLAFIRDRSQRRINSKDSFLQDFMNQIDAQKSMNQIDAKNTNNTEDIRSAILVVVQRNRKYDKENFEPNLQHACLDGLNLSNLNLEKFNFSNASLKGTILKGSRLAYANFNMANLDNAKLQNTKAFSASFMYSSMKWVRLDSNSSWMNVDLRYATLNEANINGATLDRSDLRFASFKKAKLMRSRLRKTYLEYVIFDEAELRDAIFTGATGLSEKEIEILKKKGAIFRDK